MKKQYRAKPFGNEWAIVHLITGKIIEVGSEGKMCRKSCRLNSRV